MLRSAACVAAIALVTAGGASAEVVARGVQDGLLALDAKGAPSVAWVHNSTLFVAERPSPHRWTRSATASVPPGSSVVAFEIGAAGPVALVQSGDDRTIELVRRRSVGWQTIRVAKAGPLFRLGWPGLALDGKGLPVIGYTRWNAPTLKSRLLVSRVDAKARISTRRITQEGFPKSLVPPPAAPVLFGDVVHVVESYGYRGVLGTIEWFPSKKTWIGLGLDAGLGDYPVGPVFAGLSANGVMHAAWTESLLSFDLEAAPVTLVERHRFASSEFVLDRALTSALALPATGPEVAANQWIGSSDLGLEGESNLWGGTIVRGRAKVELDGWISGYAAPPAGGRDVLLGGSDGLRWFHVPGPVSTRVTIAADDDGVSVILSGRVGGVANGTVTLYRERPGEPRTAVGHATVSGGEYQFVDRPPERPLVYRAVYTDRATGIPYGALLRKPVGLGQ
jgi:hypothetical protein